MATDQPGVGPTDLRRTAFLLDQVARAPGTRLTRAAANAGIPAAVGRELGLSAAEANRLRDGLAAAGFLAAETRGRVVTFRLTEAGAARLESVRAHVPPRPVRGKVHPPADEGVRRDRVSCLLLQVLRAGRPLTAAEANRFSAFERDPKRGLHLNSATAAGIRRELAADGLLTITRNGRTEQYALTREGRQRLGAMAFAKDFPVTLPSPVLNDLLDAAREAAKAFEVPPGPAAGEAARPVPAGALEAAILAAFEELRRERHSVGGLVPVHEVRAAVRERLGPAAARHDTFDDAVLGLWRAGRLGLTPIADQGRALPDQLRDAIPGVGETLFYLRGAHEPAAV